MPDSVQQSFVRSFIVYLKKQVDGQCLAPDALESVEVAIQCLQAAFDIVDDEQEHAEVVSAQMATSQIADDGSELPATSSGSNSAAIDPKNIQLFELFQSLYIERNPEKLQLAESIKNEGNRLMKESKYNEALLKYNDAVTYDPKNPIFYCNRAAAHIRLGDNDRAVTDCKSALLYNTNYGKAYGRLGIAYSNLGKYDEAQQAYAKAIELEPDNQDYRNNLEIARNARQQSTPNISHLTDGLNAMLGNPAIRNLFSTAEIDLEQLQTMTQNPMIMNTIGQILSNMQGGGVAGAGGGGGGGGFPAGGGGVGGPVPMPNYMLQMFQNFAVQLANASQDQQNQGGNNDGTQPGGGGASQPSPPNN